MRILIVNKFDRVTGGADTYALQLLELLRHRGHTVRLLAGSDGTVGHKGPADYLLPIKFTRAWRGRTIGANTKAVFTLALQKRSIRRLVSEIASFSPDVIHAQNLYYQFSPHLITELRRLGAPMLQTLHDYSYACNNNYFYHHGRVCEDCRISRLATLVNRCYSESLAASTVAFVLGEWRRLTLGPHGGLDVLLSPSRFLMDKFLSFGFPKRLLEHVPPFVLTSPTASPSRDSPDFVALFVGRLESYKGADVAVEAAIKGAFRLRVVGGGPMLVTLQDRVAAVGARMVEILGPLDQERVTEEMKRASVLLVPSRWYENLPMVILEAFRQGLPVLASAIGGIPEAVSDDVGGLVPPDDPAALADLVLKFAADRAGRARASREAVAIARTRFSPALHAERLEAIYGRLTLEGRGAR